VAFTYDVSTPEGQVRLLVPDNDVDNHLLEDADITALLTLEASDVRRAAATALELIASSEALVSKKIKTQDLSTDGPAVARELRERAKQLRAQAEEAAVNADGDEVGLEIVDFDRWAGYSSDTELAEYLQGG
jgi:hypothetical protein